MGLGEVIERTVASWPTGELPLERSLFGTGEPDAIAAFVDRWCAHYLGVGVERYEFFASSAGSVHGVVLRDGRQVVVKGYRAAVAAEQLHAFRAVQRALHAGGYPAPEPVGEVVAVGVGHVAAETMLDHGEAPDVHDPWIRRALARGLAELVERSAPFVDRFPAHFAMRAENDALYPEPHSARMDFAATSVGAEWIDEFATEAQTRRRAMAPGPRTVVHGDWRVENLAVRDGAIVGVFDWDSVHAGEVTEAVAGAAVTFCVDWRRPGPRFPNASAIAAFVDDFEAARGEPFSPLDTVRLALAMVGGMAYGARCEHAIGSQYFVPGDSFSDLLRAYGRALLDAGLDVLR